MRKLLAIGVMTSVVMLLGCGEETASDKVRKFIETKDTGLLSKSKTSMCTDEWLKSAHFIDGNLLPTTNDYYQVSKYLYGKIKYSIVSEKKVGDSYIVTVKVTYPKAIRDAKSFIWAESEYADERDKKNLDNLNALYESGGLKDLEFEEEVGEWIVLNDGIDPKLSEGAVKACSASKS
ncbi:hypothetical protein ACKWMY_09535 [Serratia sp. J2]|uniref:hypothetical protein n=1 Tax=Serratia sp. J2 TaxID=3386551 RepID=UPI003916D1F5